MDSQSATSIGIAWDTPDNGGTPLTSYKIYSDLATDGASYTEIIPSTGLVNSYLIDFSITADSVYRFKVLAVNVLGDSPLSPASDPIRAATVPSNLAQPQLVEATTSQVTISWLAPTYDGGSPVLFYSVYTSTGSALNMQHHADTADDSVFSMTITGLTRGLIFYYRITATNLIGESSPSVVLQVLAAVVPDQPGQP
jgi:hypothetical protein